MANIRQLDVFYQLLQGQPIFKKALADTYQVSEKTIQRDVSTIRDFLETLDDDLSLTYDDQTYSYSLSQTNQLNPKHVLTLLRILLAHRPLTAEEFNEIQDSLLNQLTPDSAEQIKTHLRNETRYYKEPQHKQPLLDQIWQFENFIQDQQVINFDYERDNASLASYTNGLPVALISDAYYFYVMIHFKDAKQDVYMYRLDRFINITPTHHKETVVAYNQQPSHQINHKKLRQENPLMQIGNQKTVTILFTGILEALQDKFPTATVLSNTDNGIKISITGNWSAIKMWLLSQGPRVKVVAPMSCVADYKDTLAEMLDAYKKY